MTKVQQQNLRLLRTRTERMQRLLDSLSKDDDRTDDYLHVIIREAALIYFAACSVDPALAGTVMAEALQERYALIHDLCTSCGDAPTSEGSLCAQCIAEVDSSEDPQDN